MIVIILIVIAIVTIVMRYGLWLSAEICGLEHELGEHKPGRIKPGRIKRAALSLQGQNCYILFFVDTTPFICL